MGTFLNPGDATDKMHQAEDAQLVDLKLTLQGFASRALEITPRRLRNQSHKTWLELGGDSLTAVNFMGLCHDAGIDVDIPDVFLSASLDELLARIAQSHHEKHGSAKNEDPDVEGNGDCNGDAHCFRLLDNDDPLSDVLRRYGPLHEVQAIGPCSPMQENFMALQQIDPQAYQLRLTARLGSTNPAVVMAPKTVGQAWEAVVRRHVALRTMFVESVDRPGRFDQVVWKNARPQISVLSLAEVDTGDNKERESGYESEFPHHLILAQEPENKVLVKLFISHAIADGVSIEILFRDLFNALREPGSLSAHEEATLKAEDFIHAQQPDTSQDAFSYWSRYVSGAEGTFLSSPSTKERPTGLYSIDQDVLLRPDLVQALSSESKATMVNACQVAYALVLRCYTGTSNISFSYTTAGRQKRVRGLRHAVGAFLNTLPCRLDLADTPTITEALSRTQRDFLDSLPYQGADLTDKHGLGGKSLRELGDSLLSFYGGLPEAELLADAGLTVDIESWDAPSDYNHTLMIGIGQHKLQLRFTAWKSLISRDDAHNMMQLFQKGLEFVLQNTSQPCSDFVGSLTRQDEAKILATNRIPPKLINNCVHEQVWAMAQRQPDAPAICAWDGELTYSELEAKSRRLAAHLVELGAGLEVKVGLCMDKSRWGPVAMLAILQAGAAVVPLGTQHPLNRTQTIARNADMKLLLADKVHAKRLEGIVARTVVVDEAFLNSLPPPPGTTALSWPRATPDNAGWVVYTSGSTGIPKGVVLQHKALCTPMHAQAARYGMGPGTRALNFSALTFDITVKDFFTTLSFGGCVCVPSETQRLNDLEGAIREFGVNFATLTPTVTSLLDPRRVPTLRTIVGTGEALKQAVVQPWLEEGRVKWYNAYGPSECSHTSTINGPITHAKDASNIGFPALNCLWVTDPLDFNGLSPIGAVGELLIEGPIAREYLHDPAKTAASFVVDPDFVKKLGLAPGRRMYRTGDLVRQNKDGSLTYLGRRDTQIKIRGQRVEVREIESCISQSLPGNPTVCVELVRPQGGSDSVSPAGMLVAAIDMHHEPAAEGGPAPGTLCEPSESLRDQLQSLHSKLVDELPLYMVPSHLVPFGVLPTNASGKQDRQATRAILEKLTDSELGMFQQANDGKGNIFTETERSLQAIWAEALGRPAASIGSNDHFLQAGGDSVVAMRMVTIARKHNVSLSVADITSHPRLADMARVVDGYHHKLENAAAKDSKPFELWKRFELATAEEKQRRLASVANPCKISPDQVVDVYPASPLQEGLMAMTSQEPGTYVAQQVFEMSRKIDVERFQNALAAVAASLAILRTRIVYTPDSGSVQVVARYAPPCRTTTTSDLTMFLERERTASFAYGTPLHRFSIVNDDSSTQTSPEGEQRGRYFIWTAHHSGYDGETISKTLRMLAQVYQGGSCDTVPPITRFVRYLTQQIGEESEGWERTKAYWKQELEGAQLTRFPEAPSPTYRPFADGFLRHRFAQLGGQGTIGRVSLAILLRAAWALVVSSRTGSAEAMLAVVLSGRDAPVFGIESVVAPTITTVPVRVQIHRGKAVGEFLSDADTQNKNMVPYTQFGLANIRREVPDLGNDFDPGHLFAVHVGDTAEEDLAAVRALGLERMAGERQNFEGYALVVECMLETSSNSGSTSIEVEVHFDKSVISPGQVVALVSQLEHVMTQLEPHNRPDASLTAAQREATIGDLDLIAPDEKEKLLAWNRPPPAPVQTTLYELFQKQSRQTPHSQAICARGRNFTYSQLDEAAGRLAQHLIASGVGPEILVGVCMDKSEFAIVSMLAISRAGGAVVPLGIQFSDSRLQGLIADAGISIVLVDGAQAKRFGRLVPRHIVVNSSLLASLNPLTQELIPRASPQNVAWVIFTSGSTGVPKGVVLEHQALCSGVLANGVRYGVTPSTRTFAFSAFTFDVSITDLWTTLAYGGCVCVPSEQDRTDNVVGAMNDFAITFAVLTPTVTSLLDPDSVPASLDTIVFVGEAIKPAAVEPWLGLVEKLFNGYGPAECSIYSVINGPILRAEDAPIIGSNVSNRLWVTDTRDHNSLVPIGAPGELLIEGPALARSYLHDPAKTAKSFVVDPKFVASLQLPPGRRMYRTGDLVRQNPEDGSLVCLGRIDTQVKIRGQRVEVGEIESNIVRLRPEIQHACVDLVKLQGASDPMLLAAVEIQDIKNVNGDANGADLSNVIARPLPQLTITLGGLRAELAQILPLYMVPARIVPMKFPVNASGKLDRRATREMLEQLTREQLRELADEPTRNGTIEDRMLSEMEEQLRLLWAQVLGIPVEEIRSAEDDFFQLGGDSVSAMRLVAAAQAAPKPMRLGVLQILKNPTLVDMARVASKHSAATAAPTKTPDPAPFELWDGFNDATPEEQQKRLEALAAQCRGVASPDEIVDVYPSTSLQEGLMAITSKQTSAYVAQQVFRLGTGVDVSRLQHCWDVLSSKLAILRTRIVYTAQGSVQVVVKEAPGWEFASDLSSYLAKDQSQIFAYGTPLHRQAIVHDPETDQKYFVWTLHHAAYDGWSLLLVLRMFVRIYQEGEAGLASFAETPISRFIKYLKDTDDDAMTAYWRNQLEGAQLTRFPPLPSSAYQPHAASLVQTRLHGLLEKHRSESTNSAGGTAASLGTLLQAAWAVTVATYTGSDEALVNVALSGRDAPVQDIANVVGPTLTTVPVRVKINKEQPVASLLAAVAQQAKEMGPFAHAGLHRIRNAVPGLGSNFDAGHLFIIQPALTDSDSPGLEVIGLEQDNTAVADSTESRDFGGYALAVDCTVDAGSVHVEIRYDNNVLSHASAAALLSHFEYTIRQLEACATGPDSNKRVADLDLFSPADADLVRKWNQNTPPAKQACIHELIQQAAARTPNSLAVKAWDGEFSYTSLDAAARRLARHLVSRYGIGPEVTVGLCMDKSCWAVVSMLAILVAGGVVVPLGVQQPLARIEIIVKDSALSTILVDVTQAARLGQLEGGTLPPCVVVDSGLLGQLPPVSGTSTGDASIPVCDKVSPDNAAWIVYTSGSTGVPKGVVLEHKALCSSFEAHGPRVGFGPDTRALQFSSYTFDNCIEDILSVLSVGGCVCVPSEDQRMNSLTKTIRDMNINLLNTTPTVASLIQPADVPSLKTLLLGGESVYPAVVEQWLGHAKIINTYGPAECSVDVACSKPMTRPSDAYTVGFPLNVCFWVVNAADYNRLVPVGAPGELLVEGPHLGRGYLNDTDKTAKAFVWDPDFVKLLGLSPGRRMYRTGDLVQQNADGSLIHLGRIDTQIKIRGQRVETGEIESTIVRIQRDVRMACVELVRLGEQDAASADPVLVAAIEVGDFGHDGEVNDSAPTVCPPTTALCAMIRNLRAEMLLALPRYMVPRFVPMTRLPLNVSSKLDRRTTRSILAGLSRDQLAEFEKLPAASVEDGRDLSPMERQLGRLLSQVLGCSPDDVGPDAHFVQLGGDSVTAMRLVAAAQGEGIRIGVADILQNPRLLDLARVAESYSAARSMDRDPAPFELWTGFADAEAQEQQIWLERIAERCDVAAQEIEDVYPATPLQEGLMAVTAQQPGAYVAQHVFRIGRGVDIAHFRESWSKLIDAVAILRTRIVYHAATSDSMQVVVRRTLDWNEADSLEEYLANDKALPFSYGTPLNRLAIVRKRVDANDVADEATSPYFVWTQHHSGYDGYQMALVLNMLAQIYQKGEAQPLPSLPPIPRFIKYLQQTDPKQSAAYWKQQLQDAHLTRFPRLPHPLYHPHADGLLERRVVQQQGSNSKPRNKSTPIAIVLRAAWAITVAAYTGSSEATSTVALAGRDIAVPDIGNMVVPTLATVPMRTRLDDRTMLVSDLLAAMTRQSDEMRPFLHTGMQHIRAAVPGLGLDFDPGHLFLVQPSMGDADNDPLQAIGLEEVHATDKADFGGYALAVQATVNPDRTVDVELRYDSKAFPEHMAEALFSQFEHIIQQLEADNSDKTTLGELELLTPIDVERLRKWNAPMLTAAPNRSCIHDLVQTVAERQPQVPAVKSWDGELSYAALSKASSRLAHYLVSIGVGPEVSVGVCMDKSMWATVSMLAILQAGGVVVALGTQYPLSRIGTVVADAGIRVTLADGAQAKRLQDLGKAPEDLVVAVVDRAFVEQLPAHDTSPPCTDVRPDNAAWVVYTSGSTGTPKGVVLEHQALCTGMIAHGTLFGIHTHTRALSYAAHTFSVVIEDFTTLILGGCICIPSENQRMNISELSSVISDMRVNFVNLTATAASLLDPSQLPDVKTVVLGGEAVTSAVVELWAKHATIINAYGQSECSVESVINNRIEHGKDATNIGLPIAKSAAWVVDPADYNRLVPVGAPGELLIQGPLLARGYLNDRAKTEACFVSDPTFLGQVGFSRPGRGRMYRTGDLVCQTEDGSLVYLGRSDAQIKIRGQRVEPGEIESRIVQVGHQHIAHAFVDLVTPRDASHDADPILTAAIELQTTEVEDVGHSPLDVRAPAPDLIEMIQRIRAALLQELPAYMIPSYFLPLTTRLPVNASGKLDRRAARAMLETLSREKLGAFSNRMAKNPNRVLSRTEEQLRTVYAEVLGCPADNIGPDDFFTELGGDSVAAMHVVGTSRRRGMIITVLDVLQRQSVSAVAEAVETRKNGGHDLHQDLNEASSAVTDIQEWMLNYHTARPEVGMTWFALDAPKPLADAEKMAEACRRLFAVVEALHTGFVQEADGKWRRVILPEYQHQVQIHNTAAGSVDKWTEDFIQRERSKPIESARPLADVAICTTTREHRILFRMSHAIYDGMCLHRFWSTLDDVYRTGQAKEMASFSQYVAHVENRRTTEASKYWAELLKGATMTPIGTPTARVHDKDNYIWRAGVIGPAKINLGKTLPKGTTCANVVKAAWTLVLARHAKRNDVVFVDLVSGRAGIDPSVTDALGCCSTPVPVRVQLDPLSTYADLVRAVQKQQLSSIPFETFGYGRITQDCTDWPSGTAASSWINHVPAPIKGSKLSIGGTEYTLSQPKQEEQNWTFSEARISWTHSADTDMLEFHLVYAVDKVSKRVAQDLYNGMVAVIDQILTAPQALIGSQLVRNL